MKKLVGILAMVCAVVLSVGCLLCGCADWKPERPEDTNLEFWILDDVADFDWSEYVLTDRSKYLGAGNYYFGKGYDYTYLEDGTKVEPEYYVEYHASNWPDLADRGGYITHIGITDPDVIIYGLTVNSTFEEFEAVFQKKGYDVKKIKLKEKNDTIVAKKNGFSVMFGKVNDVSKIRINATVTNNTGIVF